LEDEKRDTVNMNTDDSVMSAQNNNAQQEMPSDDDLETYRIVFELFDRDRSGFIDNHDLAAISVKLGKDPSEGKYDQIELIYLFICLFFIVFALIGNFDLNQDGKISFGEFVQSLWHL